MKIQEESEYEKDYCISDCAGNHDGLAACGGKKAEDSNGAGSTGRADTGKDTGVQVDEGLLNVEITMPASFFEEMTTDEIKAAADEQGYKKCVINEDGSVTYTMSKSKHKELLTEFKNSIDETIENMVNGEDAMKSFQKIEYNDDISQVDIYVDKEIYTAFDAFSGISFYFMGAYYQIFSGSDPDSIDIVVNFIDAATNETLATMSYRDFMESVAAEDEAPPLDSPVSN